MLAGNQPWSSVGPDGTLIGYEIDIATMIGQTLDANVEFVRIDIAGRVGIAPFSWTVCMLAGYGSVRAAPLSAS